MGTEKEQNRYINAFTAAAFQGHLKVLTLLINTQVQVTRDDLEMILWRQRKDDPAALDVILQARPNMSIDDELMKVPLMQDHPQILDILLSKATHRPTSSCLSSWMLEQAIRSAYGSATLEDLFDHPNGCPITYTLMAVG